MPPRRQTGELSDDLDSRLGSFAEMFIRSQERSDDRFARLIEATAGNGKKSWATIAAIGAMVIAAVALLANLTGAQWRNAGESALSEKVAVLTEKLESSEKRQVDAQKTIERSVALLDERNRQLSIVLEARGLKMPKQ